MENVSSTVGFIGLGSMGNPMVRQLHLAGFPLYLFDIDNSKADKLKKELGATVKAANSCKELAQNCQYIITMLPNSHIVQQVMAGTEGILAGIKDDTVWMEMSSGIPHKTQEFSALVTKKNATLLDAPVSGGVSRAKIGDLSIMVGGNEPEVERAKNILSAMGSSIMHTGNVGTAHAMKALNNLVSAGGFLIGIEALMIGQRFGLDPDLMVDILNASTGSNNSTQKKFKQFVLSRAFNSGFGLDLMVKDLSIALDIAKNGKTPAPFSSLCSQMWASAQGLLGEGQDHTAVTKLVESICRDEIH